MFLLIWYWSYLNISLIWTSKYELLLKFCSFAYFIVLSYKGLRLSLLVQNVFSVTSWDLEIRRDKSDYVAHRSCLFYRDLYTDDSTDSHTEEVRESQSGECEEEHLFFWVLISGVINACCFQTETLPPFISMLPNTFTLTPDMTR